MDTECWLCLCLVSESQHAAPRHPPPDVSMNGWTAALQSFWRQSSCGLSPPGLKGKLCWIWSLLEGLGASFSLVPRDAGWRQRCGHVLLGLCGCRVPAQGLKPDGLSPSYIIPGPQYVLSKLSTQYVLSSLLVNIESYLLSSLPKAESHSSPEDSELFFFGERKPKSSEVK